MQMKNFLATLLTLNLAAQLAAVGTDFCRKPDKNCANHLHNLAVDQDLEALYSQQNRHSAEKLASMAIDQQEAIGINFFQTWVQSEAKKPINRVIEGLEGHRLVEVLSTQTAQKLTVFHWMIEKKLKHQILAVVNKLSSNELMQLNNIRDGVRKSTAGHWLLDSNMPSVIEQMLVKLTKSQANALLQSINGNGQTLFYRLYKEKHFKLLNNSIKILTSGNLFEVLQFQETNTGYTLLHRLAQTDRDEPAKLIFKKLNDSQIIQLAQITDKIADTFIFWAENKKSKAFMTSLINNLNPEAMIDLCNPAGNLDASSLLHALYEMHPDEFENLLYKLPSNFLFKAINVQNKESNEPLIHKFVLDKKSSYIEYITNTLSKDQLFQLYSIANRNGLSVLDKMVYKELQREINLVIERLADKPDALYQLSLQKTKDGYSLFWRLVNKDFYESILRLFEIFNEHNFERKPLYEAFIDQPYEETGPIFSQSKLLFASVSSYTDNINTYYEKDDGGGSKQAVILELEVLKELLKANSLPEHETVLLELQDTLVAAKEIAFVQSLQHTQELQANSHSSDEWMPLMGKHFFSVWLQDLVIQALGTDEPQRLTITHVNTGRGKVFPGESRLYDTYHTNRMVDVESLSAEDIITLIENFKNSKSADDIPNIFAALGDEVTDVDSSSNSFLKKDVLIPTISHKHATSLLIKGHNDKNLYQAGDRLTRSQKNGTCWFNSIHNSIREILISKLGRAQYKIYASERNKILLKKFHSYYLEHQETLDKEKGVNWPGLLNALSIETTRSNLVAHYTVISEDKDDTAFRADS